MKKVFISSILILLINQIPIQDANSINQIQDLQIAKKTTCSSPEGDIPCPRFVG